MAGVAGIERAVAKFAAEPNNGLIVTASSLATIHSKLIIDLAARHRLPAVYPNRLHVIGGVWSPTGRLFYQFRGAANYVDRLLKGAKPGDLPVQTPSRYELALSLKTARPLGLPYLAPYCCVPMTSSNKCARQAGAIKPVKARPK
jgi:ABC-type uncharacterized transport system substrate-binding protein